MSDKATSPFAQIREHVLLPWADDIAGASRIAHQRLTAEVLRSILALVPDEWLLSDAASLTAEERRGAYLDFFLRRLAASSVFEEEVTRARQLLV